MTGQTQGSAAAAGDPSFGPLDDDTVRRIDVHLERALQSADGDDKDFHVRHARQLLEACRRQ